MEGEESSGAGAQVLLNPQPGSFQGGIGLIYGFVCEADRIDLQIDNGPLFQVSYGSLWIPSLSVCGDKNNGFVHRLLWNTLSNGNHHVRAFSDGTEFADVTFSVTTLGFPLIPDDTAEADIENFPWADSTVHIRWQGADQNFVIDGKFGLLSGVDTLEGQNVVISPVDARTGITPLTLTFSEVTQDGSTSLITSNVGPPPPTGFRLGTPPIYYDLSTTATFSSPISVCVDYSGVDFPDETQLAFFHFENDVWVDRTLSHDLATKIICASVTSLSPFAILVPGSDNTSPRLLSLSSAQLWVGLKNSDDIGTQFDLRADVYKNGSPVATGQILCVTGIPSNPTKAKQIAIPFGAFSPVDVASGDTLSLKISTRIGTTADGKKCSGPGGSHSNAIGLRMYYDAVTRPSQIGAEITPDPLKNLFLHSVSGNFLDTTASTSKAAKFKDSGGVNFSKGNSWQEISTWSETLP